MKVFHTVSEIQALRDRFTVEGKTIGFVPTMGALHAGHLSLIDRAAKTCDVVVVSIFVNPSQFAPTEDLDQYPRTLEKDCSLIEALELKGDDYKTDQDHIFVFAPTVDQMYPSGIVLQVDQQEGVFISVLGKSHQLEGKVRPTFFRGVATVVTKLLNAVQPHYAFFGQKDAQQCVVVKQLVRDLLLPVKIVLGPIVREEDGLAKSSRNQYLSEEERAQAPVLYNAIKSASDAFNKGEIKTGNEIKQFSETYIEKQSKENNGVTKLDYISVAHPCTLEEIVGEVIPKEGALISGAVKVGKTRIIDNIILGIDPQDLGNKPAKT